MEERKIKQRMLQKCENGVMEPISSHTNWRWGKSSQGFNPGTPVLRKCPSACYLADNTGAPRDGRNPC